MANTIMTVIPLSSFPNSPYSTRSTTKPLFTKIGAHPFRKAITKRPLSLSSSPSSSFQTEKEEALSIAALQSFINLNLGNWVGSFYQFNPNGEMLNKVATKLAVSSYVEDDLDISSTSKGDDVNEEASSTSKSADVTTNVHWTGSMLNN